MPPSNVFTAEHAELAENPKKLFLCGLGGLCDFSTHHRCYFGVAVVVVVVAGAAASPKFCVL